MQATAAVNRYLEHYLEPDLPPPPANNKWRHCIVIPVYKESAQVLQHWLDQPFAAADLLVIFVINRPTGSATNANDAFREASLALATTSCGEHIKLLQGAHNNDALIIDLDFRIGPLPAANGVGLARKIGCDLAFVWQTAGIIETPLLFSTDADATLPNDYFSRVPSTTSGAATFTFPFMHIPGSETDVDNATLWYEMWLHHYVLGLEYAESPYAYHSLGSCLAISSECYAQVGGFPKRAGGEDFYLLNKANKTRSVVRLSGEPIKLRARRSARTPFGTGPAVQKIMQQAAANTAMSEALTFYHPQSFAALRVWLQVIPALYSHTNTEGLEALLEKQNIPPALAAATNEALRDLGVEKAFEHCRAQGKTQRQFTQQFHQWFDGFRTLKLIHALRENGWPELAFEDMLNSAPHIWPTKVVRNIDVLTLQNMLQTHWSWR